MANVQAGNGEVEQTKEREAIKTRQQMAVDRQDIRQAVAAIERAVRERLGELALKTDDNLENFLDTNESQSTATTPEGMEPIKEKMEGLKKQLNSQVEELSKPLYPKSPSSEKKEQAIAQTKESLRDVKIEEGWGEIEEQMEGILEEAAATAIGSDYDKLASKLKDCLLCFTMFPQDAVIKKRCVIYWWIGEKFVEPIEGKTAEEVGEGYFNQLVENDFIQLVGNKRRSVVNKCKMHPWIRWMLISKARAVSFFEFDVKGNPSMNPTPGTTRAGLVSTIGGQMLEPYNPLSNQEVLKKQETPPNQGPSESPNLKETDSFKVKAFNLSGFSKWNCFKQEAKPDQEGSQGSSSVRQKRSQLDKLFNVNVQYLKFDPSSFSNMKMLVILQLGRWQANAKHHIEVENAEIIENLGLLTNLRFLSLRGISRITKLPTSIKALRKLEVLDLRGCQNLEELTDGITFLSSLTHLDVSECYMLESMPRGLGSLSKLEVLKGFVFGSSRSKNRARLGEIVRLVKLRKLSLSIGVDAEIPRGDLNDLQNFKGLRSLAIVWSMRPRTLSSAAAVDRFTALELPTVLEKLDLRCFPKTDLPDWFQAKKLVRLKKLYIRGGRLKSFSLQSKGEHGESHPDWMIEELRLKHLHQLESTWTDLKQRFPKLAYLEFWDCPEMKDKPQIIDNEGVWVDMKRLPLSTSNIRGSSLRRAHELDATTTTPAYTPAVTDPTLTPGPVLATEPKPDAGSTAPGQRTVAPAPDARDPTLLAKSDYPSASAPDHPTPEPDPILLPAPTTATSPKPSTEDRTTYPAVAPTIATIGAPDPTLIAKPDSPPASAPAISIPTTESVSDTIPASAPSIHTPIPAPEPVSDAPSASAYATVAPTVATTGAPYPTLIAKSDSPHAISTPTTKPVSDTTPASPPSIHNPTAPEHVSDNPSASAHPSIDATPKSGTYGTSPAPPPVNAYIEKSDSPSASTPTRQAATHVPDPNLPTAPAHATVPMPAAEGIGPIPASAFAPTTPATLDATAQSHALTGESDSKSTSSLAPTPIPALETDPNLAPEQAPASPASVDAPNPTQDPTTVAKSNSTSASTPTTTSTSDPVLTPPDASSLPHDSGLATNPDPTTASARNPSPTRASLPPVSDPKPASIPTPTPPAPTLANTPAT